MRDLMTILTRATPKQAFPSELDMEMALVQEMPLMVLQMVKQINEFGYLYLLDSDKYMGLVDGVPMMRYVAVPPERVRDVDLSVGVCTVEQVIGYGGEPDVES